MFPCNIVVSDEEGIIPLLGDADVLVTMGFTAAMGARGNKVEACSGCPARELTVSTARALPAGTWLANVYGHETGIAEYAIGAMLALTREFSRLDAALRHGEWQSQWAVGSAVPPVWQELAGKTLGISRLWADRPRDRTPGPAPF